MSASVESVSLLRRRSPNFTKDEVHLLLYIAVGEKFVIENKKTDATTWKEKDEAWERICTAFNSQSPQNVWRNKDSLRKLYDNKKKELRKEAANSSYEVYKTGGGPTYKEVSTDDELLLTLVNNKTISGTFNPFDSDNGQKNPEVGNETILIVNGSDDQKDTVENTESFTETLLLDSNEEQDSGSPTMINWGDYKPSHLRTKPDRKLKPFTVTKSDAIQEVRNKAKPATDIKENNGGTHWHERRRPIASTLHTSTISKQYTDLAGVKMEIAILDLASAKRKVELDDERRAQALELQKLQMEGAKLDIDIKKAKLDKLYRL